MSRFIKTVEDCPDNVRRYVSQTLLVHEYSRILREIDAFKNMAICTGYDLTKSCDRARWVFSAISDEFDLDEKAA